MRRVNWSVALTIVVAGVLSVVVGCGQPATQDEPESAAVEQAEPAQPTEPASVEVDAKGEAILARADLADGTEDHVVSKCIGCGLAMPGKDEQTVHAGDYELHFCSDHCRERFEKEPATALAALDFSEEDETTEATN